MPNQKSHVTFYQNPKIDFLFGIFGGKPIPPKHDQFKAIDAIEVDENGNEKILKDFYLKKSGKNTVAEFEKLLKNTASGIFNDDTRIRKPNEVEVVISVSALEKQFKIVDVDNLAKSVLDGLTGVAFDDDSQVTNLIVNKHIHPSKTNGVFIGITKLTKDRHGILGNIKLFQQEKWK
ncbi:RusA family crossover junction endodeoxyribonuclease [Flagellimonas meridianipacifica]|uniref:Holliday junction resolvase RusA-like endonuclease n=1 Tax=Flagellimonas meridianipacifica TaxID=1080225 RepID=A0A2T0MAF9_9FLAO|nr:RusA family crossover junction endodeoxyribonuclease [Allomuricauda pacifica]PRX54402.1 Holliday junction resolvase RusA-like endonuclease [Allomuricauda pacifica]